MQALANTHTGAAVFPGHLELTNTPPQEGVRTEETNLTKICSEVLSLGSKTQELM